MGALTLEPLATACPNSAGFPRVLDTPEQDTPNLLINETTSSGFHIGDARSCFDVGVKI